MAKVNRSTLQSYYQNPGDIYDDTKTEGAINTVADQVDANDTEFQTHKDSADHDERYYSKADTDTKVNNATATKTVSAGSVFPIGPYNDGQEFYRNDLKTLYIYDAQLATWVVPDKLASVSSTFYAYKNLGGF